MLYMFNLRYDRKKFTFVKKIVTVYNIRLFDYTYVFDSKFYP